MGIRITEWEEPCRVAIDGEVTIATVAEIKALLADAVTQHEETEIDLGGVEEIDTAGLQVMLAAKRCEGRKVRFVNHSEAVLQVLELANLGQQLGDPLLIRSCNASA